MAELVAQHVAHCAQLAAPPQAHAQQVGQAVATTVAEAGKSTAISGSSAKCGSKASTSSSGASQGAAAPASPRRSSQAARGSSNGPGGASGNSRRSCQGSSRQTSATPSRKRIRLFMPVPPSWRRPGLERLQADPVEGVDETFRADPQVGEGFDDPFDHRRHLGSAERWPDHLAQRAVLALGAAEGDLVPLAAVLVDAEDADVADVVVAAGVHAAGDVQAKLADVVQVVEVLSAAGYPGRWGSTWRWPARSSRRRDRR